MHHTVRKYYKQKQENQIKAIRSFIQQDVDYIVVAPVVETGWETVLEEAKEADSNAAFTESKPTTIISPSGPQVFPAALIASYSTLSFCLPKSKQKNGKKGRKRG